MIIVKSIKNNKTNIIHTLNQENTTLDLLKELYIKNGYSGKLILCGKIINNIKIKELQNIYKYWNGKIIFY